MANNDFGASFTKWLICKRFGAWFVIPPRGSFASLGAKFSTGAEAIAAFVDGKRHDGIS